MRGESSWCSKHLFSAQTDDISKGEKHLQRWTVGVRRFTLILSEESYAKDERAELSGRSSSTREQTLFFDEDHEEIYHRWWMNIIKSVAVSLKIGHRQVNGKRKSLKGHRHILFFPAQLRWCHLPCDQLEGNFLPFPCISIYIWWIVSPRRSNIE